MRADRQVRLALSREGVWEGSPRRGAGNLTAVIEGGEPLLFHAGAAVEDGLAAFADLVYQGNRCIPVAGRNQFFCAPELLHDARRLVLRKAANGRTRRKKTARIR